MFLYQTTFVSKTMHRNLGF